MSTSRKTLVALAAVAFAQTVVLGYMVIDRVQLLRTGREVVLPIVPVDPRDLFRGEYVRLGYDIGNVTVGQLGTISLRRNDELYVVLEKKSDGTWHPVELARSLPRQDSADRLVVRGRSNTDTPVPSHWVGNVRFPFVRYGIESYFVPEGEGRRLEALAREKKLAVLVAVDRGGNAAIKGLIIDGKLQYEEPLF
jgi:uncharacterized membrane-anchored protein